MFKNLWVKFLILILGVSLISLSSVFFLRELMIKDFKEYFEGEMLDRVHWVTADLEGTYEKYAGWKEEIIGEDTIWALMLGLEIKIINTDGQVVMETEKAVDKLSPLMKRRVLGISNFRRSEDGKGFMPYPLFLSGKEIGQIEVRFLTPMKEGIFVARSNKFLLLSLLALGGVAFLLSIILSRKLTKPIKKLALAAKAIGEGDLKSRASISGHDEIGELSKTFNRMAEVLETQESIRKRVISNVAHELRTPIAAIRGEIEGMMDGFLPIGREQLQSLHEETGRLKKIIEGIEDLSQAEASSLSLKKERVKLEPFLRNIVDRFSNLFAEKRVSLELECDAGLMANADPDRLSQILINLLSNALKATEIGGRVRIKASGRPSDVLIEVVDNGCGIRQEDLPFIFERFYKAKGGGIGIGLAIAKELVQAHGGKIEVKSEYGNGSVFAVSIPSS
jgi:two-component system sensor histidine kinase BaeS